MKNYGYGNYPDQLIAELALKGSRWNMIKRFITWLYTRYVLQPEICAGLAAMQEPEFEIVVVPDVVFEAQIQANHSVKHWYEQA